MESNPFGEPFVGREEELNTLRKLLLQSWEGKGSTVFINGIPGMGKTALLGEMQAQISRIPERKTHCSLEANVIQNPVLKMLTDPSPTY